MCGYSFLQNEAHDALKRKIVGNVEAGLEVVEVDGKGRGVVTSCRFSKSEFLCEYAGELISEREGKKREQE